MPNVFILSSARSGSSLFVNYLNSHHHIRCWGEILNAGSGINVNVDTLTQQEIVQYVGSMMRCDGTEWVGAKIHTHQLYELPVSLSSLLECAERPHVIVLYRESLLETYVSLQIALQNNVWYSTSNANVDCVFVDWGRFQVYRKRELDRWAECLQALKASQCPFLMVSFERLVANAQCVLEEVFDFLGLPSVVVETESVRQNPCSLEGKISNWCELPAEKSGPGCRLLLKDMSEAIG